LFDPLGHARPSTGVPVAPQTTGKALIRPHGNQFFKGNPLIATAKCEIQTDKGKKCNNRKNTEQNRSLYDRAACYKINHRRQTLMLIIMRIVANPMAYITIRPTKPMIKAGSSATSR